MLGTRSNPGKTSRATSTLSRETREVRNLLEKKMKEAWIEKEGDTLSLAVLLRLAFERVHLHRVIGRLEARNTASARVLEKLGMRKEAHLVENEYVKDEWQSEIVFAMLAREWNR